MWKDRSHHLYRSLHPGVSYKLIYDDAITFGLLEIDHLFEDPKNFINISEDVSYENTIPKDGEPHNMTYEEIAKRIHRGPYTDTFLVSGSKIPPEWWDKF